MISPPTVNILQVLQKYFTDVVNHVTFPTKQSTPIRHHDNPKLSIKKMETSENHLYTFLEYYFSVKREFDIFKTMYDI